MTTIQGDIYSQGNLASSKRVFVQHSVHIGITRGAIFKNRPRGYDLIGLKYDGSNELAWLRTTTLSGSVGTYSFPESQ